MTYCNHCMNKIDENDRVCAFCGQPTVYVCPNHHLFPGTLLNKKFLVGAALGEGGFGITYIGRDLNLDSKVAIKEYYPNGYANRNNTGSTDITAPTSTERKDFFDKGRKSFLAEARALAKFRGEAGIVDVLDFFEENNTAYIVMEYLDGKTLKQYLQDQGVLKYDLVIKMLLPVMRSLQKVHREGIIHRDISPDNIMIMGSRVKLLDFGAARNVSAEANKSLSVMLKPGYAPEEQYRSRGKQGPWTDIYALCATIYKCITGVAPEDSNERVIHDELKKPSELGINIDPKVENVLMKGLAVFAANRYQNIESLLADLAEDVTQPENISIDREPLTMYRPQPERASVAEVPWNAAPELKNQQIETEAKQTEGVVKKGNKLSPVVLIGAIAGILAVAVVILVFVVIGRNKKPTTVDTVTTDNLQTQTTENNAAETTAAVITEAEAEKPVEMSDNLFDFTFELQGVLYQLPFDYKQFTENGWTISTTGYNSETMISGSSYDFISMVNDGRRIDVYIINMSGNAKPLGECKIGGVECDKKSGVSFAIAKGITCDATVQQIKDAFGTPSSNNKGSDYTSLEYKVDDSYQRSVRFYIYDESSNMTDYSSIEIKNFVASDDDKTETNSAVPQYLSEYKAPAELGDNLKSGVLRLENKLYQLPAPISEFINDGWSIAEQSGDVVAGGTDYIEIEKGSARISARIMNYADYQTIPENCAVFSVDIEADEAASADFELPGSIKLGITKADVQGIVDGSFDYYDGTYSYHYSYSEYKERDFNIDIDVDKESGVVDRIKISEQTWKY